MYKEYNINQIYLPLNIEIKLEENDIAFAINQLIESIPDEIYTTYAATTGCPAYHPKMMMKIILCAYTQSVFSGRKIEALLKDSVRMMWLAQGQEPSYRTINRFRSDKNTKELLRQCFIEFRSILIENKEIDNEAIFIDGTKIEANANKFTFSWRKATERYSNNLIEKSNKAYEELLEKEIIPAIKRESPEELTEQEIAEVIEHLEETVETFNKKIEQSEAQERKVLRNQRKEPKSYRKQFAYWLDRKKAYKKYMKIYGVRNSYSKTDHDATFMRMKDDYMRNGYLKAGYNLQVATEGQYALAYDIFHNPNDTRTLIPFLDTIEKEYFALPEYLVADAGYGSEQNYDDIITRRNRTPLITYNRYRSEKKKKYKNNPFNTANWNYNKDEDYFTCPNNKKLVFSHDSCKTDSYGFKRDYKVYKCEDCSSCPYREKCTKLKEGSNRTIVYNPKWEKQKLYIREKLSKEKTAEIYSKRKIDVEPFFGFLKENLGFTRLHVRGKSQVHNELGFALMAVNLRKFVLKSKGFLSSFCFFIKKGYDRLFLQSQPFPVF